MAKPTAIKTLIRLADVCRAAVGDMKVGNLWNRAYKRRRQLPPCRAIRDIEGLTVAEALAR